MVPQWVIEKKRNGLALDPDEIRAFIRGYTDGTIPDYQMAALAMAIYFQNLSDDETATLTYAMLHSGIQVDASSIPGPKVDKHSTGGIGDKVSLLLAPLAACCGVVVPMISGRGLGITGGTLDKLEAIPGYRTDLSLDAFLRVLRVCGCAIIGQTAEICPADRKLYALRDVTATVPSIPLIAASIMSKKLAEGLDALVLDVKCGAGAFMKTAADARRLATAMVGIGRQMGKPVTAVLTDMNQPLGRAAGNALEIVETIEALRGHGPADLMRVTLELGAHMLVSGGVTGDLPDAHRRLRAALVSGAALERFKAMILAQGGDGRIVDDPSRLAAAPIRREWRAEQGGWVARADADALGRVCLLLGAGRTRVEDRVDHAVGLSRIAKIGDAVKPGDPLVVLHARDEKTLDACRPLLQSAFAIADAPVTPPPLLIETLGAAGGPA